MKKTNDALKEMIDFKEVDAGWWENESGQFAISDPRAGYSYNPDNGVNQKMKSDTPTGKFELYAFSVNYDSAYGHWVQNGKRKKLVGLYGTLELAEKAAVKLLKAGRSYGNIESYPQYKYKAIAEKNNWGKNRRYGRGSAKDWRG